MRKNARGRPRSRSRGRRSSRRPARAARSVEVAGSTDRRSPSRRRASAIISARVDAAVARPRASSARRGRRRRTRGRARRRPARAAGRARRRARRVREVAPGSAYCRPIQRSACASYFCSLARVTARAASRGACARSARCRAVPERAPREEAPVGHGRVVVRDDGGRHVPALPARVRGAVAEVDVLAVEAEARVEAAELVEHRAAQEQEGAEHPVGLDRLGRALVEVVVRALALVAADELAQRRAADERAARRSGSGGATAASEPSG